MKRLKISMVVFLILLSGKMFAQGPYAPGVGQDGCTAIHKSSEQFVCWASGIQLTRGWTDISTRTALASYGYPGNALHAPEGGSMEVVSLGDGGEAILTFNRPIVNGPGYDFVVFENSFDDSFLELAFVEVSSDGVNFFRFPAVSLSSETEQIDGFGQVDPTNIHNFAGKYRQGYGTPFDLDDVAHNNGLDVNNIRFVKLIDVVGCIDDAYATYDSEGHKVNDPWPTDFNSSGFDLDGVGVINAGNWYNNINFSDLTLEQNSYWDGSDGYGSFTSGILEFINDYDATYGSWQGFAYSNMNDITSPEWTNQFSAITGGGMDAMTAELGTNYAVAFVGSDWAGSGAPIPTEINLTTEEAYVFNGMYVTNGTYPYFTMRDGDNFSAPFGGTTGDEPDYFKLNIYGIDINGNFTDTVEFYLADYRFEDNSQDYIVNDWRWVDLTSLGEITGIRMYIETSNTGAPTYFCIDNIYVNTGEDEGFKSLENNYNVAVYPNPTNGNFTIETADFHTVEIHNAIGQLIYENDIDNALNINISDAKAGLYIIRLIGNGAIVTKKIVKR